MDIHARSADAVRPVVDRVARRISDPVLRLRFLKAAAPRWIPGGDGCGDCDGSCGSCWRPVCGGVVLVPRGLLSRLRASGNGGTAAGSAVPCRVAATVPRSGGRLVGGEERGIGDLQQRIAHRQPLPGGHAPPFLPGISGRRRCGGEADGTGGHRLPHHRDPAGSV